MPSEFIPAHMASITLAQAFASLLPRDKDDADDPAPSLWTSHLFGFLTLLFFSLGLGALLLLVVMQHLGDGLLVAGGVLGLVAAILNSYFWGRADESILRDMYRQECMSH